MSKLSFLVDAVMLAVTAWGIIGMHRTLGPLAWSFKPAFSKDTMKVGRGGISPADVLFNSFLNLICAGTYAALVLWGLHHFRIL